MKSFLQNFKALLPHLFIAILLIIGSNASLATISERANSYAKEFRQTFPFHMQTIALSAPKDGKRVLIVSEPPPHVKREDFRKFDRIAFGDPYEHEIGFQGFTKDVVIELPTDKYDDKVLPEFLARLGQLLYFTSYKLPVLDLDKLKAIKAYDPK